MKIELVQDGEVLESLTSDFVPRINDLIRLKEVEVYYVNEVEFVIEDHKIIRVDVRVSRIV